ncbi:MAG: hypothetical protein IPM57_10690 [Oligoflexia bacterium]|nr:hypothetical protein [Oligoflexia bacterium]
MLIENLNGDSSKPSEKESIFEGLGMIITELGEQAANVADFMDASIAQRGKRK